jgi:hypothetical protein
MRAISHEKRKESGRVARQPDFIGDPVFAGGWLENRDAFRRVAPRGLENEQGGGLVMDTIAGPVVLASSWSLDGRCAPTWMSNAHSGEDRAADPC